MTRPTAMSFPGAEFNDFLFAPIGEDSNGMLVSVLSGLARLDVDSWQEAEKLAQLPGEIATQRLASLIGPIQTPPTIATRLIALLPNRNDTKNQSRTRCTASAQRLIPDLGGVRNFYVLRVGTQLWQRASNSR